MYSGNMEHVFWRCVCICIGCCIVVLVIWSTFQPVGNCRQGKEGAGYSERLFTASSWPAIIVGILGMCPNLFGKSAMPQSWHTCNIRRALVIQSGYSKPLHDQPCPIILGILGVCPNIFWNTWNWEKVKICCMQILFRLLILPKEIFLAFKSSCISISYWTVSYLHLNFSVNPKLDTRQLTKCQLCFGETG